MRRAVEMSYSAALRPVILALSPMIHVIVLLPDVLIRYVDMDNPKSVILLFMSAGCMAIGCVGLSLHGIDHVHDPFPNLVGIFHCRSL